MSLNYSLVSLIRNDQLFLEETRASIPDLGKIRFRLFFLALQTPGFGGITKINLTFMSVVCYFI
jgi:hypothetical protein